MNITLTPEIEKALREHARKQGTSPEVLVLHALRELFISSVATGTAPKKMESCLIILQIISVSFPVVNTFKMDSDFRIYRLANGSVLEVIP